MMTLRAVAHAEKNEGARAGLQHEGEILAAHDGRGAVVHTIGSHDVARDLRCDDGFTLVIDGSRIHPRIFRLRRSAIGTRDAVRDLRYPALHQIAHTGIEGAHRAAARCSRRPIPEPISTLSIARCGPAPPWPPLPCTTISKRSAAASSAPGVMAKWPSGRPGIL